MIDLLNLRMQDALMAAEERVARAERRRALNGYRIHWRPARREGRQRR